jgi:hypothetical protein
MKNLIPFLLLLFFISCNSDNAVKKIDPKNELIKSADTLLQKPSTVKMPQLVNTLDSPYYYKDQVGPTPLKGGYQLIYAADDSLKYVYLKNGESVQLLKKINNGSYWYLGTLGEDYDDCFILNHDNGNGCPHSFELFDKKTGENHLGKDTSFCSYLIFKDTLFMIDFDLKKNNLTLFNGSTNRKEYFNLPDDITQYADIELDNLTNKKLTISYSDFLHYEIPTKTKTYNR